MASTGSSSSTRSSRVTAGCLPKVRFNGVRVASIVHDLAPALAADRRLAPLRRHDAVLAVSEATAADCRKRLGTAGWRVATIGVGCDETFAAPGCLGADDSGFWR